MSNVHNLHPVSYLLTIIDVFKRYWYVFVLTIYNLGTSKLQEGALTDNAFGIILIIISIFLISTGIIEKWTVRYWFEADKIIYKSGLFVKNERELSIDRIQSIDITQPILARLFNVAVVNIKSPAESISLPGVKYDMAESIRTYVYQQKEDEHSSQVHEEAENESYETNKSADFKLNEAEVVYEISPKEMLLLIATSGGLGMFLTAVAGGLGYFGFDTIIVNAIESLQGHASTLFVPILIAIGIVILFIGIIIGGIIIFVRYYGYQIKKHNDDFIIQYGLLERKTITINKKRIQNISVREDGLFERLFKIHALYVGITSNDFSDEDVGDVVLTPVIRQRESYKFLNEHFSEYNIERPEPSVPIRAYRRYFQVSLLVPFMVISITSGILYYYDQMIALYIALLVGVFIIVLTVISGIYSAKNSGVRIENGDLNMLTTSSFKRSHYIFKRSKIIDCAIRQTIFTERANLGTIEVKTASGLIPTTVDVKHLEYKEANEIFDYVRKGVQNGESI